MKIVTMLETDGLGWLKTDPFESMEDGWYRPIIVDEDDGREEAIVRGRRATIERPWRRAPKGKVGLVVWGQEVPTVEVGDELESVE